MGTSRRNGWSSRRSIHLFGINLNSDRFIFWVYYHQGWSVFQLWKSIWIKWIATWKLILPVAKSRRKRTNMVKSTFGSCLFTSLLRSSDRFRNERCRMHSFTHAIMHWSDIYYINKEKKIPGGLDVQLVQRSSIFTNNSIYKIYRCMIQGSWWYIRSLIR